MSYRAPRYTIEDLLTLMSYLRTPIYGCPWDLKQTYKTIAPSTLEEAYEVVDAIEQEDQAQLKEELGDLLFQVIFYCQLAKEEDLYDFNGVVDGVANKLISRHPHVFKDGKLELNKELSPSERLQNDAELKQQWEELKRKERGEKGKAGLMEDVPVSLPAFVRAVKLQKRAAQVNFDWSNADEVVKKLDEEIEELKTALNGGKSQLIEDEIGDLFFTLVNLCRHVKVDPEASLRKANAKFTSRFQFIESKLEELNTDFQSCSSQELESFWEQAKVIEN